MNANRWPWFTFFVGAGITAAVFVSIAAQSPSSHSSLYVVFGIANSLLVGFVCAFVRSFLSQLKLADEQSQRLTNEASALQEKLSQDVVIGLMEITCVHINNYYNQTHQHSKNSFVVCCTAAVVSLVLISFGVLLMFADLSTPAYVTTATGVLTETFTALFFYLYNRTIIRTAQYHNKLVLTQNVALAMSILREMDGDRLEEAQLHLIEALTSNINDLMTMSEGLGRSNAEIKK